MAAYRIEVENLPDGVLLKVGFGDAATGETVMADAHKALSALDLKGGKLARVNGPATLAVAAALGHVLAHRFGAVAFFDPKRSGYIVAISHDPGIPVGGLIN